MGSMTADNTGASGQNIASPRYSEARSRRNATQVRDGTERELLGYLHLDAGQLADLRRVEQEATRRARHEISLATLVLNWVHFVLEVERGYQLGGYDYTNDLDTRRILEDFMDEVPGIRPGIQAILQPCDHRFRDATVESNEPLGGTLAVIDGA